jgi:hypothetical protein
MRSEFFDVSRLVDGLQCKHGARRLTEHFDDRCGIGWRRIEVGTPMIVQGIALGTGT